MATPRRPSLTEAPAAVAPSRHPVDVEPEKVKARSLPQVDDARLLRGQAQLDGIAARIEEARTKQMDPLDFLLILLEDELLRRDNEGVTRRVARARFEEPCDLRDFDFSYNPEIPKGTL